MKKLLVFVLLLLGSGAFAQQIDIGPLPKARPFDDVDFFLHRDTVTISFTGDVMQHGAQIDAALKKGGGKNYNYENAFKYVAPLFRQADYMVANMEFTVGTKPYTGYPCFSAPPEIASAAKNAGIDLFLMANNHICDKNAGGLKKTLDAYENLDMPKIGAYRDKKQADTASVILVELKGMKFAMFNYTYDTNGLPIPEPYYVNLQDSTEIKKHIRQAKAMGADIIIALPHWGIEYVLAPVAEQKQYAKMMFREGVNAIIGGHPHVPEEGYIYVKRQQGPMAKDSVENIVFYSMGNYISNMSRSGWTSTGMLITLSFTRDRGTGKVKMLMPDWKYLWCFRPGQYTEDFSVVPIEEFLQGKDFNSGGKTPTQIQAFKTLEDHYQQIIQKDLIKVVYR
jgi:poly-gamma-glutamate synthesis protein (capsule biosynthesis protein)